MDKILGFLSEYATSLTYDKLPKETVHEAKRRVVDSMGCAMGAYMAEPSKIARAHALEVTSNPCATVLGTRHCTTPELATFANGVMVRYLDYNDRGLAQEAGHPSDNIPAVLAAAECAGSSGATAITGITLAYELECRFGEAARVWTRGWDHVTYEAISAAAGAGKALGLTRAQMANAIAIATTANIGLLKNRLGALSMWKGCAAGNACGNGVFAARLAKRGLTGPEDAFEGRAGFFEQVTGPLELPDFGGNGRHFKVEDSSFKFYPADYEAQAAANPAVEIHQLLKGKVDDIERIVVDGYTHGINVAADTPDKWNPQTRETADHSIPYVVAVALTRGAVEMEDYTEERIRDPKLHALMKKIEVRRDVEFTSLWPEANPFRIEVTTGSGERYTREVTYAKGHVKNTLTDKEIEEKFCKLTAPLMKSSQIKDILRQLWRLEEIDDLRGMMSLFELKPVS